MTRWIELVKGGDEHAAQQLWERYFPQLVRLCGARLRSAHHHSQDGEDVALSAFASFFRGVHDQRFPQLWDRDDLWRLLVTIAARKAIDLIHYDTRQRRDVSRTLHDRQPLPDASQPLCLEDLIGPEPTPEFAAIVTEELELRLSSLADRGLQEIAVRKLQGYSNEEIAAALDCAPRTIERKLNLIRTQWREEPRDA